MPFIDIYFDREERRRKRRRKWLVPLIVGFGAALALGRERLPPPSAKPTLRAPNVVAHVDPQPPKVDPMTPDEPPPPPPQTRIALAPAALEFGGEPLTSGLPAQLATVRNDGTTVLPPVRAVAGGPFLVTSGCTEPLAPGSQCSVAVVFAPRKPGKFSGSLAIAAGEARAAIPMRGTAAQPVVKVTEPPHQNPVPVPLPVPPAPLPVPAPQPPPARTLCFDPPFIRFHSTGRQTITLTNPESAPLRVVAVLPIGTQGQSVSGYEIESAKCLRVLNPGEQCRFTVRANDQALQTHETMQLTVYYEDPANGLRKARFSSDCGKR